MSRKSGSFFDMQSVTSSISTMLVLVLLGLVVFFVMTANNLSAYVRENIAFTLVMSDDLKETDIIRFQKRLDGEPYVKQTAYVSKAQALKEQSDAMGTDPTEFLGYNPFSASLEVRLNAEYANPDSVEWIKEELAADRGVAEISYPHDLLDSVNRNLRKASLFLLGLAALLTLVSFALINNTIRLAIYSKRFLIHTMKLVGAGRPFIRRPFLARNLWAGALAGAMADAALGGMAFALVRYEPDLVAVVTPATVLTVMCSVFVFGVAITALCALISINKFLRMSADRLYSA